MFPFFLWLYNVSHTVEAGVQAQDSGSGIHCLGDRDCDGDGDHSRSDDEDEDGHEGNNDDHAERPTKNTSVTGTENDYYDY